MEKKAQERGFLNTLREKTNLTGKILESINPEFQHMMEQLRSTDKEIRNEAKGIRDVVKWARSLVNRRDYLSAAVNFSTFHERCRNIAHELEQVRDSVNLKHYKFLLDQFDDEYKEKLFGYDPNKPLVPREKEASQNNEDDLVANGAFGDFISMPMSDMAANLTRERSRAMKALESRFSVGFLKKLKADSNDMADMTEHFLTFLLATFKKLATAVATRNATDYISYGNEFIKRFAAYHAKFVKYYSSNILPLKEKHEEGKAQALAEQQKVEMDKSRALEEQAAKARGEHPKPPSIDEGSDTVVSGQPLPNEEEKQEALRKLHERYPESIPQPAKPVSAPDVPPVASGPKGIAPSPVKVPVAHQQFINKLEKLASSNDAGMLATELLKYAAIIEEENETDALKLIAIAEGIVEDYKKANIFDWSKKPKKPHPFAIDPNKDKPEKKSPLV